MWNFFHIRICFEQLSRFVAGFAAFRGVWNFFHRAILVNSCFHPAYFAVQGGIISPLKIFALVELFPQVHLFGIGCHNKQPASL